MNPQTKPNQTKPNQTKPNQTDSGITSNEVATNHRRTIFSGRRINISVTGLDGRIGYLSNIADANHVLSILIDAGEIEITSIPRDTYCDLGIEIVKGYDKNKLTYCRPLAGRERYQQELARIAKLDTIHYYIEFGFSQAIGIIEFLGYKEPENTLQVLRNRKALGGDDYQRCYSQGQFIRQALLKHFNRFTGITGGLLASAGLALVETNLSGDKAAWIIEKLEKAGFPKTQEVVRVRVCPTKKIHYKDFDFGEEKNIEELVSQIEEHNTARFKRKRDNPQVAINVSKKLDSVLASAAKDTAAYPTRTISKLKAYFAQRAWYQVKDKTKREQIRDEFGVLLTKTYTKIDKPEEASKVIKIIEADKKIFEK